MPDAITNTSPLLYLYRIHRMELLHRIFDKVITVSAVNEELLEGFRRGYDVPDLQKYAWLQITSPKSMPSEWLASDLGRGELEVISLALELKTYVVVLDDALARRIAKAAGLTVWGTLRVLLEGKRRGIISEMASVIDDLRNSGMWISDDIRQRILALAGES
jgi:predicted nucleic acid-binding protein